MECGMKDGGSLYSGLRAHVYSHRVVMVMSAYRSLVDLMVAEPLEILLSRTGKKSAAMRVEPIVESM